MINEDYVSFEVAKLLKEKGFDKFCDTGWDKNLYDKKHARNFSFGFDKKENWISRPTHQMAMKWLRENNNLAIIIKPRWAEGDMRNPCLWFWEIMGIDTIIRDSYAKVLCASYQEAVEAAIKYCLENLI